MNNPLPYLIAGLILATSMLGLILTGQPTQAQIDKCIENTNYTEQTCINEMMR